MSRCTWIKYGIAANCGLKFPIKQAKRSGIKFTFGTNNVDHNLGRLEYCLKIIQQCGLTPQDMWMQKPDGHSHLQATLLGPSLSVPVTEGKPLLGMWQQIIHLECDVRPRRRTVVVTVMGE